MDTKLKHPATFCAAGPTSSGKTNWVCKLIKYRKHVFVDAPERIIWCYGQYQPAYEELSRDLPNIQFIEGLPEDWSDLIDPGVKNLIILDDLMSECVNDPEVTKLFTRGGLIT